MRHKMCFFEPFLCFSLVFARDSHEFLSLGEAAVDLQITLEAQASQKLQHQLTDTFLAPLNPFEFRKIRNGTEPAQVGTTRVKCKNSYV